jgi:tRNA pseudouridine38-40 synthase
VRTVQEELEGAIAAVFGEPTRTVFAGRTDRGVHAAGQVVGCQDRRPDLAAETLRDAFNARLADDVAVLAVERKPDGFHARYDARWREYRYRIWCGTRQPLARQLIWQRSGALDPGVMDEAAQRMVGERDFAALAGSGDGVPWSDRASRPRGTVRRVLICRCSVIRPWWGHVDGRLIELSVVADGFLPRMVRNIAAVLVEIGRGRRPVGWIDDVLSSRDRRLGPATAPAHGVIFWRVGYEADFVDDSAHADAPRRARAGGSVLDWE